MWRVLPPMQDNKYNGYSDINYTDNKMNINTIGEPGSIFYLLYEFSRPIQIRELSMHLNQLDIPIENKCINGNNRIFINYNTDDCYGNYIGFCGVDYEALTTYFVNTPEYNWKYKLHDGYIVPGSESIKCVYDDQEMSVPHNDYDIDYKEGIININPHGLIKQNIRVLADYRKCNTDEINLTSDCILYKYENDNFDYNDNDTKGLMVENICIEIPCSSNEYIINKLFVETADSNTMYYGFGKSIDLIGVDLLYTIDELDSEGFGLEYIKINLDYYNFTNDNIRNLSISKINKLILAMVIKPRSIKTKLIIDINLQHMFILDARDLMSSLLDDILYFDNIEIIISTSFNSSNIKNSLNLTNSIYDNIKKHKFKSAVNINGLSRFDISSLELDSFDYVISGLSIWEDKSNIQYILDRVGADKFIWDNKQVTFPVNNKSTINITSNLGIITPFNGKTVKITGRNRYKHCIFLLTYLYHIGDCIYIENSSYDPLDILYINNELEIITTKTSIPMGMYVKLTRTIDSWEYEVVSMIKNNESLHPTRTTNYKPIMMDLLEIHTNILAEIYGINKIFATNLYNSNFQIVNLHVEQNNSIYNTENFIKNEDNIYLAGIIVDTKCVNKHATELWMS